MGHVMEKVLADVCVRWFRLRGDDVRFQIGTDEHGIKIQQTAEKEGITPQELVDRNVPLFRELYERLQISADRLIRTSDQNHHWPTVIELWKKLEKAGALEKRTYAGLYCSGCERFITQKELVDGKCPIHQKAPEKVKEENWFFLLKREAAWLKKLLQTSYKIIPEFRAPETFSLLEQGLEDVSFSRPRESLSWGIPVPGDEEQTMYVWCDALTNYISGLGKEMKKYWDEAEVTHVIGKDIARFHALIWPAMLKNAGIRTPDRLLIHGFLTSEGEKMSKSLGNVVVPQDVIDKYGVDALRFYLSHEIPVGNDGDFSWKRFGELYDAMLRNNLGNLLNRVLVMLKKETENLRVDPESSDAEQVAEKWKEYESHMEAFRLHDAVKLCMEWIRLMNAGLNDSAPWKVKDDPAYRMKVLSGFAEYLRHVSLMLLPFMPETVQKISTQLNVPCAKDMLKKDFAITIETKQWGGMVDWKKVGEPEILFPPVG